MPVSQYSITSVSIWSGSTASSGRVCEPVHSLNFSRIQVSTPIGESSQWAAHGLRPLWLDHQVAGQFLLN